MEATLISLTWLQVESKDDEALVQLITDLCSVPKTQRPQFRCGCEHRDEHAKAPGIQPGPVGLSDHVVMMKVAETILEDLACLGIHVGIDAISLHNDDRVTSSDDGLAAALLRYPSEIHGSPVGGEGGRKERSA